MIPPTASVIARSLPMPLVSLRRVRFEPLLRTSIVLLICCVLLGSSIVAFGQAGTAPSTYSAYTGTDTKTIPPAPALGAANSVIQDPTFGSRILRVTDQNTRGGESFISTDSGFHRAWNADSTAIKLTGPQGDGYWLEFNKSTFTVGDGSSRPAVHPVSFGANWEWSTLDPNVIYYLNRSQIWKYNKSTGVSTNIGGPSTGDPLDYMAVVIGHDDWVCSAAGAGQQNTYTKIFCIQPANPSVSKLIDVYHKTINGVTQSDPHWPTSASGLVIGVHDISGGTGPSWLEVTFHQQNWGANGGAVFNLSTNTWSLITNGDVYWSGHVSMGNGKYANASGSVDGRDSRGMVLRDPDDAMSSSKYRFVYQPPDTSNGWRDADHSSWLNSLNNANAPVLISRYNIISPYNFAWAGEIDAAAVDGSNTVWRFAHNHNGGSSCYYGEAFAQISNDGNWALFSSTWDGALGSDSSFGCSTRLDTFIVELVPGSGSTQPPPPPPVTPPPTPPPVTPPPTPPPAPAITFVQQNNSAVVYTGTWFTNNNSIHNGGSAALAMDKGSRATLTFSGTGVSWVGYRDGWSGIANVYLDGAKVATVDTYASSAKAQAVLYSTSGLTSATHTLAIEVTQSCSSSSGGDWVWIDGFEIAAATTGGAGGTGGTGGTGTTTGTPVRYQQNSSAVKYTGTWFTNNNSVQSGGSAALAMNAGSKATFSFTGTAVSWIGCRDEWAGIAKVYIDNVLVGTVDTYSSAAKAQTALYSRTGLARGTHSITIEVTGTRNPSSGGSWIWVDAFDVIP